VWLCVPLASEAMAPPLCIHLRTDQPTDQPTNQPPTHSSRRRRRRRRHRRHCRLTPLSTLAFRPRCLVAAATPRHATLRGSPSSAVVKTPRVAHAKLFPPFIYLIELFETLLPPDHDPTLIFSSLLISLSLRSSGSFESDEFELTTSPTKFHPRISQNVSLECSTKVRLITVIISSQSTSSRFARSKPHPAPPPPSLSISISSIPLDLIYRATYPSRQYRSHAVLLRC